MASFSKYFREAVKDKSCADFFHPGKTCGQAKIELIPVLIQGVVKYYLPILLIPSLGKFEWSRKFFWEQGQLAFKAVVGGFLPSMLALSLFCGLFDYLKKHYYQFYILPISVSASIASFTLPYSFVKVLASGGANHVIEFIAEASKGTVLYEFKDNVMLSTLLFMTLSSTIVYLFKTTRHRPYWLLHVPQPDKENSNSRTENELDYKPGWFDLILRRKEKICSHKDGCEEFIWKVLYK